MQQKILDTIHFFTCYPESSPITTSPIHTSSPHVEPIPPRWASTLRKTLWSKWTG